LPAILPKFYVISSIFALNCSICLDFAVESATLALLLV
jgi:hypothetical protein